MEVELKLEPGRQEPKVVILAGEDSPSLERLRAHLSGLSLGPITVWRGERALPVRQEEFLRFFADGKGVSAQTENQIYAVHLRLYELEERLDTKYGVVLLQPAYTSYQLNLGEISSYPPGYKENAGIFCHNNPWISCAEATLGHGDRAFAVYRKTCPAYIEDISDIHRTEPYVYSQMVAGKDAPTFGEAKNSWLTGTAAWTFFNISQYILGIQPTLDGLKVDPCIPHTLSGFTVTRRFRGAVYHITVDNAAGVQHGIKAVTVDGKAISGNVLPLAAAGAEIKVQVTMG